MNPVLMIPALVKMGRNSGYFEAEERDPKKKHREKIENTGKSQGILC